MNKKIAILSGKGGTGKTSIAVNLSVLLADSCASVDGIDLLDLDVEEPNASHFFKQKAINKSTEVTRLVPEWQETNCSLCNKCSQICEFNAIASLGSQILIFKDLCHSCHACSILCPNNALEMKERRIGTSTEFKIEHTNLNFTEYRLDVGQPSGVPLISRAMDEIKAHQNRITIIDSPPGTACPMVEVVKNSDYIVLVTEPTPFGLHDLKLAVDTVRTMDLSMGILINKSGGGDDEIIHAYCNSEELPILGHIPHKREIAEAYSRGELVFDLSQEIRTAYTNFSKQLIEAIQS